MLVHHILVLCSFIAIAFATPLVTRTKGSEQLILTPPRPSNKPEYRNGETPPATDNLGWVDPRLNGGRFLDVCFVYASKYYSLSIDTAMKFTTRKYGEPLNIIISALSDSYILDDVGFRAYSKCVN